MHPTPREITLSSGEMALVLGGYKTLHFARVPEAQDFTPGETIHFTHHMPGGSHFSIPVVVTEATPERSNSPLTYLDEWKAGRISAARKKTFSPDVSPQRWNKIEHNLAARLAKQILSRFETPLPTEIYASDIAGDASSHPITRFSFALKLMPEETYPLQELRRRFKTAHDILAPRVEYAHHYQFSNHGHNGELLATPETSELWAMRYLATHHTPVHLQQVLARLRAPYEHLSQLNQAINETRPHYIPAPDPDGVNKALAGLPSIPCSLDTGSLAVMGVINRIAVRNPLPVARGQSSVTASLYAVRNGSSIASQRHNFQVPVEIDTTPASTRIFSSASIDKTIAREHGFANARDMQIAIGLKHGESCDIISYPFSLARAESLPLDSDRAGKHRVQQEQAARTVINTPKTPEHNRIDRYLGSLPEQDRFFALANITPPKDRTPPMSAAAEPVAMNKKGTRQLPNDVIASRKQLPRPPRPRSKEEPAATTLRGFGELAAAIEQKAAQAAALQPAAPLAPERRKKARAKPMQDQPKEAGISPIFTTPDELAVEALSTNESRREGLDNDGMPVKTARIVPKRKALEGDARDDHIARARAAKKPKDPRLPTRREIIREERRRDQQTLHVAQYDPDILSGAAPMPEESWSERMERERATTRATSTKSIG